MGIISTSCCGEQSTPKPLSNKPKTQIKSQKMSSKAASEKYRSKQLYQSSSIKHNAFSIQESTYHTGDQKILDIDKKSLLRKKMRFSDFQVEGQLGTGAFGIVYQVYLKEERCNGIKKSYAMKRIGKQKIKKPKIYKNIKFQKYVLSQIVFPFITELIYSFQDSNFVYFVMECANQGNVYSLIFKKSPRVQSFKAIGEEGIRFIAACTILAMEKLHSINIMYRDLKPQNVLVFDDGYAKLTDFGLAKQIQESISMTQAGTKLYFAPQIMLKQGYTKAVDFWTLGIFIYELANYQTPFKIDEVSNKSKFLRLAQAREQNRVFKNPKLSPQIKNLINSLLKVDPEERLGAKGWNQIKHHPFFNQFDWQALLNKSMVSPILSIIQKQPFKIKPINLVPISEKQIDEDIADDVWEFNRHKK